MRSWHGLGGRTFGRCWRCTRTARSVGPPWHAARGCSQWRRARPPPAAPRRGRAGARAGPASWIHHNTEPRPTVLTAGGWWRVKIKRSVDSSNRNATCCVRERPAPPAGCWAGDPRAVRAAQRRQGSSTARGCCVMMKMMEAPSKEDREKIMDDFLRTSNP